MQKVNVSNKVIIKKMSFDVYYSKIEFPR